MDAKSTMIQSITDTLQGIGGSFDEIRAEFLRSQLECLDEQQLYKLVKQFTQITVEHNNGLDAIHRRGVSLENTIIERQQKAALSLESITCGIF